MKNQEDYFDYNGATCAAGANITADNINNNPKQYATVNVSGTLNLGPTGIGSGIYTPGIPLTSGGITCAPSGSVIGNPTWITTPNTTTLPYYGDHIGGSWTSPGTSLWPSLVGQFYDGKPSWLEKSIDKKYIRKLIDEKNYNLLCNIADIVIKSHRSSFHLLERSILKSNDFEVIALYMKSVKNIGVRHLTRKFLEAYGQNTEDRKSERFTNLAYETRNKLDLKTCFRFAIKKKDPAYINWLMSSPYYQEFDNDMVESKISNKNIDALISMCGDVNFLFTLANISKMANKEKIYRKIRKLGNFDLARKLVDNSEEDWAKKLVHMK